MNKLLEGLRVVEMGTHVAVPKTARMMGDWGADVIKVEPPAGDTRRTTGRSFELPYEEDNNPLFQSENANKKAIALNLKTPEGKEALLKLLETADVFITNTRPAPLTKLGLDYDSLKDKFPKLIYAQFTGFGLTGPDKDRPGFDLAAYWARSGVLVNWAYSEAIPSKPIAGFGDSTCAALLLSGILGALYKRAATGQGDKIDLSLYGSAIWFDSTGMIIAQDQYGQKYPKSKYAQPSPVSPPYKTADGDWILMVVPDWDRVGPGLLELFGLSDKLGDEGYTTLAGTRKHMPEVIATVEAAIAKKTTKELLEGLVRLDVVHERLSNPAEIAKDPQAWENGYLEEVTLEAGDKIIVPTSPLQFANAGKAEFSLAPHLGEHTRDVLKEIGYSDAQIEDMIAKNIAVGK